MTDETKGAVAEPRHCDDYINDPSAPMDLRWFLFVNRLPATEKMLCRQRGVNPALFARYEGKAVRVVMASRLGDVGITENLYAEHGYSNRVAVEDLTDFSADRETKGTKMRSHGFACPRLERPPEECSVCTHNENVAKKCRP